MVELLTEVASGNKDWLEVYRRLDLPIIIAVILATQALKGFIPERLAPWRKFLPFFLGAVAGVMIQPISPYAFTMHNLTRRTMIYGSTAFLIYNTRDVWITWIPTARLRQLAARALLKAEDETGVRRKGKRP